MAYIFLDESGDLGFDFSKQKTSKFFVITVLFVISKRPLEKCVRTVHRGLRQKYKKIESVLHAFKEEPITRQRILRKVSEKECAVMTIYLNKRRVYTKLQNEKAVLYNYVANILLDRIMTKQLIPISERVYLIASKRETNKFLNENFREYLKGQIKNAHRLDLHIEIKTPAEEKSLQAVDFISWAIFRRLEHGDDSYYNLIKSKIVEENPLFS
ncbi:MAG: DUF3800 domain-containing protein [Candidatus Omnitrophota bacterium]|nr:DUF3800 domain-containing protein [Candidatus Omnitrophota bacterium]